MTKEIKSNLEAPKFQVGDAVRITKYKNIFNKGYTNNRLHQYLFLNDPLLKTNHWMYKIKDLHEEIMIGSLYEKELLSNK